MREICIIDCTGVQIYIMFIWIVCLLFVISFFLALVSYWKQKKEIDLDNIKKELSKKRVIYHR
jgi:Na+/melibiose symporter-like transporter